ncbi:hypothetical protein [Rhodococcus sp. NPDC049939]|uniref:hypothetical protein n=1 Tax=Rhodococcus sp. NPDC049939 TaxID=3155511 RepID=UPI003401C5F3
MARIGDILELEKLKKNVFCGTAHLDQEWKDWFMPIVPTDSTDRNSRSGAAVVQEGLTRVRRHQSRHGIEIGNMA